MKHNPCLMPAIEELRAAGVYNFKVNQNKHFKLRWAATPTQSRCVTLSGSPSNHNAAANARADVRRLLKLDGIIS